MSLTFTTSGTFDKTDKFLAYLGSGDLFKSMEDGARSGVAALAAATPTDSGASAASWDYILETGPGYGAIWWTNSHVDADGTPIVVLLEFGHGTGTGGYVQGRDFINPAITPIMDQIANNIFKEVQNA